MERGWSRRSTWLSEGGSQELDRACNTTFDIKIERGPVLNGGQQQHHHLLLHRLPMRDKKLIPRTTIDAGWKATRCDHVHALPSPSGRHTRNQLLAHDCAGPRNGTEEQYQNRSQPPRDASRCECLASYSDASLATCAGSTG